MTDFLKALAGLLAGIVAVATLLITLGILKPQGVPSPTEAAGSIGNAGVLTSWMVQDDQLRRGDTFVSLSGNTTLALRNDGNLVLYLTSTGERLWNAGTAGRGGDRLVMQGDGNVVLYADGRSVWDTGTPEHPGASLALQDDSNLVLYGSDKIQVLWTTNTKR
jgi:hypothetical protein